MERAIKESNPLKPATCMGRTVPAPVGSNITRFMAMLVPLPPNTFLDVETDPYDSTNTRIMLCEVVNGIVATRTPVTQWWKTMPL